MPLHRVYDYEPLERLKRLGLRADAVQRLRGVQANLWTETVESEERAQALGGRLRMAVGYCDWPWLEHVSIQLPLLHRLNQYPTALTMVIHLLVLVSYFIFFQFF